MEIHTPSPAPQNPPLQLTNNQTSPNQRFNPYSFPSTSDHSQNYLQNHAYPNHGIANPNMMWHNTTVQMGIEKALVNMKPIMPNLNICSVEECCMCLSEGIGYELGCSHKKCSRCLLDHIYVNTQGKLKGRVPCYRCRIPFTAEVFFDKVKYLENPEAADIEVSYENQAVVEEVKLEKANLRLPKCLICEGTDEVIQLDCSDNICKKDLIKESLRQTNNTLLDTIRCYGCGKSIKQEFIESAFGGPENIARIQNDAIKRAEAEFLNPKETICLSTFTCEICYCNYKRDEGITLQCEQVFCRSCIGLHIENLIASGQVSEDEMFCPSCKIPGINEYMVKEYVSPELYERYIKLSVMGIKSDIEYIK